MIGLARFSGRTSLQHLLSRGPCIRSAARLRCLSHTTQARVGEPLKVLFCGSDEFSIHSLRALVALPKETISSIDVVCRPGKPTGRGRKHIRHPLIHAEAKDLSLRLHEIDTFTGWTPPTAPDLVIAVSFGLLVPPRILSLARHGGLNVHPSLLPDLRGPAPIIRALLAGDARGGVTVQTLHPTRFDAGRVVAAAEVPLPPAAEGCVAEATRVLGSLGAELLADVVREGRFVADGDGEVGSSTGEQLAGRYAAKVTAEDRRLLLALESAGELMRRHWVVGPLQDDGVISAALDQLLHRSTSGHSLDENRGVSKRMHYRDWTEHTKTVQDMISTDSADWRARIQLPVRSDEYRAVTNDAPPLLVRIEDHWQLLFETGDGAWFGAGRVKVEGADWKPVESALQRVLDARRTK